MPNDYWKKRMESIEEMSHKKGMAYTSHIDKQFRLAEKRINQKIEYWYSRIAKNNEVSLSAAKEMLRADELEDFHLTLEEYIEKGKSLDFDNRWMQQLENASAKVHIRRLEALQLQMQQECEVLFGNMTDGLDKTLTDVYTSAYYNTAYEFMKGHGVGWEFNKLDTRKIEQAINTAWAYDKKTFKARCWTNKEKLVHELNTTLTQSIIRGESPQKAIEQLSKRMKVSRYNAGRLIMTETCAISTMAQKGCYKELGVEKFEFVATLDSSTSDVCRSMDGQIFNMSDYKIGVNVPPLHCFCRSCTVPYYEDDFGSIGERAARGDDGKTYYVPANMKYDDWYKQFIDCETVTAPKVEIINNAKDFSKMDGEEIKQWEERYRNKNNPQLTDAEKTALDNYGEGSYSSINAVERFEKESNEYQKVLNSYGEKEMKNAIEDSKNLETAISKFNLDEDIVVHRVERDISHITGSDNSVDAIQNMIGKTYTEKGYTSTSLQYQSKFEGGKADAVHIEITVPNGSNGAYIDDYVAKNEHEFLLNKNSKFYVTDAGERVVKIQKYDFKTHEYVTVDKTERYMKVQVIDENIDANFKKNTQNMTKSVKIESVVKDLPDYNKIKTKEQRKEYAEKLIDGLGIDRENVDFKVYAMRGCYGGCSFNRMSCKEKCHYHEFGLHSTDKRADTYKIKTTFHEAYHYSLQGKEWDAVDKFGEINNKWLDIEETFAECSSHYATSLLGINNLAPSYAEKLSNIVPRLKKLQQFKDCKTIQDVGKIAWTDRMSGKGGVWSKLYDEVMEADVNIVEYHKQYFEYIKEHSRELVDKIVENMPEAKGLEFSMQRDLENAIFDVEWGKAHPSSLTGNQKIMYNNAIVNAMMQEGVK